VGSMTLFDLVMFLALFGMFIIGYFQGITRRLLGLVAVLFSFIIGAQLRTPLGGYLAGQWTGISPDYSYMVGFLAVFLAAWIALTVGIQISFRPAPLLYRYPVLDEVLGGVIGVLEGIVVLMVFLVITDPYLSGIAPGSGATGEFGLIRSLHDFIDDSISASILRENVIPGVLNVLSFLFPQSVVDYFNHH